MKLFSCLLASMFIWSCNSENLNAVQYRAKDTKLGLEEVKVISLGQSGSEIVFPIGFQHYDGFFSLMDPVYAQKCFTFFPDGRLRGELGGIGQGPGEYQRPCAMTVSHDRIFVASGPDKKINVYDLQGQFIENSYHNISGIISCLAPYEDGVIGAVYSRYCTYTLFTTDRSGKIIKTMSPRPESYEYMFDTIWPAGGLLVAGSKLYQFYNYAYGVNLLDDQGNIQRHIALTSSCYKAPDLESAKSVKGMAAEKAFRCSYTPMSGLFAFNKGFITLLSQFDDIGNATQRLEFWDKDFNGYGFVTAENQTFIGVHGKSLVFFDNDEQTRLHFVAITKP